MPKIKSSSKSPSRKNPNRLSGGARPENQRDTVREVMSRTIFGLAPMRKVVDALNLMIEKDIGSVPVIQDGTLAGIITERDIIKNITTFEKTPFFDYINETLSEASKKPVVTVEEDLEIWEAFRVMLENKIRRLPVVKNGKIVGIVTERDLFKWVVRVAYEPNVPKEVMKLL
jgi:CBS domain-containing protein